MDTCMPLLQLENTPEPGPLQGAMRMLVCLLEHTEHSREKNSTNRDSTEQVLIDIELDGVRYLLIRMPQAAHSRAQLSPREQEIVRMVAQGHPNKVIAEVLNISAWTVCTHLRRIFAKLGVGSRAAMVAQLPALGLTCNDPQPLSQHR